MAKRRKRARKGGAGMRKGSCKIVKGGRCLCRSRGGKVQFGKKHRCRRK